jgi:hypothetical protein
LKRKQEGKDGSRPSALTSIRSAPKTCIKNDTLLGSNKPTTQSDILHTYKPFISEGFISPNGDSAKFTPIRILRDTGSSQSLLLRDVIPLSEKTFTGSDALIQGVECGFLNVPLHVVNLKSDFVNGPVTVGVMHSLPVTGVHLLLGNDLAGDKVVVNPLVTANPSLDQIDPIENEIPELYPGCAVTRAMAKKALSNEVEISLSDTFMGHLPEVTSTSVHDRIDLNSSDPSVSTSSNNSSNQGEEFSQLSKSQLLKEQENDPELNSLFQMAITDSEIDQVPTCYYLKNGILMRKYRPPEISADDEWQVKHQIVVPKS